MKCPKCHSEVGSQSVCPYCGCTLYIDSSTWDMDEYSARTVSAPRNAPAFNGHPRADRQLAKLESRINLILVLQCGTFVLSVLALLILALQ